MVEVGDEAGVKDLAGLDRLFTAWCETVYHARPHGETGQPPMDRWLAGGPFPVPEPARLREAFLWSEARLVRKDATAACLAAPTRPARCWPGGRSSASSTHST